jgi:glyoxylase-like metal-dependent hydrolase (beta-lactamase superfamily II)
MCLNIHSYECSVNNGIDRESIVTGLQTKACVDSFFDAATSTATHVLHAGPGSHAAIIDSVAGFDAASGRIDHAAALRLLDHVRGLSLQVTWHLETHIHADHLSAAPYLKERLGGRIGIGARVIEVQEHFGKLFNLGLDGQPFDHLFADGEHFQIGALNGVVIAVPGHTPADVAYRIADAVFVGDTLFAPDVGSARADFPGGDARTLYRSARKLLTLPPDTRIYLCHDYPPNGRDARAWTTVSEQRAHNKHLHDGIDEEGFVAMRAERDATLPTPALMLPSLQVNMLAGRLPDPEPNGVAYIKIPLTGLADAEAKELAR